MDKISEYHKIKPAARIIETIGSDLIKDAPAAIVELVKNAYDADSKSVNIVFSSIGQDDNLKLRIEIEDSGHGMDFNTVVNKWMVPATKDKLERKYSPRGRLMQGRKGIGRYATAFLGEELIMETVDVLKQKTVVIINWEDFEKYDYLDEIEILIESYGTEELSGTKLEITGKNEKLREWNIQTIDELIKELRKLISPISSKDEEFKITIQFENFPIIKDTKENITYINEIYIIEPYPLIDLYDYRLYGNISNYGGAELIFENKAVKGLQNEQINYNIEIPINQYCGKIDIDLRVFDRDPESIENLINKGVNDLKDECDQITEDFENIMFSDLKEHQEFLIALIDKQNKVQYMSDRNDMYISFCSKLMKKFKVD